MKNRCISPLRSAMHQCPSSCQISSLSAKRCMRKALQFFLHPSLLWCPRGTPWAKVHQSGWWCIARPPLSSCQILSPSDHPSTRYLLPKLVDFIDCVSDKKRQTVNIIVPALPCGENNNKQVNVYSSSCYPLSPYKAYYINVILLPNTLTWLGHV